MANGLKKLLKLLFSLKCADFGPYTLDFTSCGRYMAAAGRKGHLAVVDTKNMSLIKEMQVCPGVAKLNEMQLGSR